MSVFSEFRDKLKVKTKDKKVKKYTYADINIREDKETGNLELYIQEDIPSINRGSNGRYRKRDTNIRNPKDKIDYTFVVAPMGHFYRREYDDYVQEKRYGRIYSVSSILQQILGVSWEQAHNMQFTKQELIDLIEKINLEKEGAIYQSVDTVQYSEGYKGERFLEGMNIARGYKLLKNKEKFFLKCIEDEDIQITINEFGVLKIAKGRESEYLMQEDYEIVQTQILESPSPGREASLGGYTLEAVSKVVERYKKEKNKEREEK